MFRPTGEFLDLQDFHGYPDPSCESQNGNKEKKTRSAPKRDKIGFFCAYPEGSHSLRSTTSSEKERVVFHVAIDKEFDIPYYSSKDNYSLQGREIYAYCKGDIQRPAYNSKRGKE